MERDPRPARDMVLSVRGLEAGYQQGRDSIPVIEDFDLDVGPGECVALIGASGAGKSTIARCLLGLHPPTRGEVSVGRERLAPESGSAVWRSGARFSWYLKTPSDRSTRADASATRFGTRCARCEA